MSYVIYHKETTAYIPYMKSGGYGSKGAATRALNKLVERTERRHEAAIQMQDVHYGELSWDEFKAEQRAVASRCGLAENLMINLQSPDHEVVLNADDYAIAEAGEFHKSIEKLVTRRNLMSGKEFQEPINTPIYCSPAFESYYSM